MVSVLVGSLSLWFGLVDKKPKAFRQILRLDNNEFGHGINILLEAQV
jgi:hypothetical protein